MNINEVYSSKYLGAADLRGRRVTVTIEGVDVEVFKKREGGSEKKLVLTFEGKEKQMVCNVTNTRMIAMLLGSEETRDWLGRSIILKPDTTLVGQEMKACLRVESELPASDAGPAKRHEHASTADREFEDDEIEVAF